MHLSDLCGSQVQPSQTYMFLVQQRVASVSKVLLIPASAQLTNKEPEMYITFAIFPGWHQYGVQLGLLPKMNQHFIAICFV